MASLHSITLDEEGCSHYYQCVFRNIPFSMPLQMVADFVVPKSTSATIQQLASLGCKIVPHKLHSFKEALPTKFGFVTFFVHHEAQGSRDDDLIHRLCVRWLTEELPTQCDCGVQMVLSQPRNCCQSGPFLKHLHRVCKLFSTDSGVQDIKKLETLVLGHVAFHVLEEEKQTSQEVRGDKEEGDSVVDWKIRRVAEGECWGCVADIRPENIPAVELGWLRKCHNQFPESATIENLQAFFSAMLAPLVTVV